MNKDLKQLLEFINEITVSDKEKIETKMIVSAAVIVKEGDNGEKMVLLIKRAPDDHWPHHWEFPRGKCDKPIGEKPSKCVVREVKEETGLDIEIVEYIDRFEYLADRGTRQSICFNFLCRMKDPNQNVKLSKEHSTYKWITQLGEADLMVLPDQKRILEKVLSTDNPISTTPENSFTVNNRVDEILNQIEERTRHRRRKKALKRRKKKKEKRLEKEKNDKTKS